MIRESVMRMNDLTTENMEFFRAGTRDTTPAQAVPLGQMMADCVADIHLRPDQVTCTAETAQVACDPHNFRRILENLVGNAFKHDPDRDKTRVEIRLAETGGRLPIEVADNGLSIAPEYHEKIFDVFKTLRRPDDPESAGIGLSNVRKIVENYVGRVRVGSVEGQGACFRFDWTRDAAHDDTRLDEAA
ncbi:sensor histidine kinase [Mesobacterium pallidum]|uniref:sensor histidine kinase n=1 Tax=Mesobacterium pallidum TaxID=2872037 RepID=UPI001EE36723|nr:ATP-binding protein [Mesobacterium pallidum]